MAVTISGDGTITGISAGGLPDNCITADDIKDSDYQAPLTAGTDYLAPNGDGSSLTGLSSDLVLVSETTGTSSGSSELIFNQVFTTDYNNYVVKFAGTQSVAGSWIWFRFHTGSTNNELGGGYYRRASSRANYNSSNGSSVGVMGVWSGGYSLIEQISGDASYLTQFDLYFNNIHLPTTKGSSACPIATWQSFGFDGTSQVTTHSGGVTYGSPQADPISGFRIGTLDSGVFQQGWKVSIYGYK